MKKKILIPTDFSRTAWNALIYATDLFKDDKCTFYILNAFQLYHLTTDSILPPQPGHKAYEQARENSEKGLEQLVDAITIRSDNDNHKFEMISTYNSVFEAVRTTVKNKKIELLMMGTLGENSSDKFLYGSNSVDVMEKLRDCPVIVVPQTIQLKEQSRKEVVFATNFKSSVASHELNELLEVASKLKAAIRVLHIQKKDNLSKEQEKNKKELQEYLKDVVHTFHTLTDIPLVTGIHSFIESRNSDMLALINKKQGFLASIFSKTLVHEIGFKPHVPLLVMHHKK